MEPSNDTVDLNVRGKRKRPSEPESSSGPDQPKRRGRPMKPKSELKTQLNRRLPPPASAHPVPTQSWLHRLPAEIIEQIFLHSLEINMAKASPQLGKTLAKESIYKVLILFAFFHDRQDRPVLTKHFAPAVYRVLTPQEIVRLQQNMLPCLWCTEDRIRKCTVIIKELMEVPKPEHWLAVDEPEPLKQQPSESPEPRKQQPSESPEPRKAGLFLSESANDSDSSPDDGDSIDTSFGSLSPT
jgi:hypothetical protein